MEHSYVVHQSHKVEHEPPSEREVDLKSKINLQNTNLESVFFFLESQRRLFGCGSDSGTTHEFSHGVGLPSASKCGLSCLLPESQNVKFRLVGILDCGDFPCNVGCYPLDIPKT